MYSSREPEFHKWAWSRAWSVYFLQHSPPSYSFGSAPLGWGIWGSIPYSVGQLEEGFLIFVVYSRIFRQEGISGLLNYCMVKILYRLLWFTQERRQYVFLTKAEVYRHAYRPCLTSTGMISSISWFCEKMIEWGEWIEEIECSENIMNRNIIALVSITSGGGVTKHSFGPRLGILIQNLNLLFRPCLKKLLSIIPFNCQGCSKNTTPISPRLLI